jgi:hypothetical protein
MRHLHASAACHQSGSFPSFATWRFRHQVLPRHLPEVLVCMGQLDLSITAYFRHHFAHATVITTRCLSITVHTVMAQMYPMLVAHNTLISAMHSVAAAQLTRTCSHSDDTISSDFAMSSRNSLVCRSSAIHLIVQQLISKWRFMAGYQSSGSVWPKSYTVSAQPALRDLTQLSLMLGTCYINQSR